jgi:hypothetical protein
MSWTHEIVLRRCEESLFSDEPKNKFACERVILVPIAVNLAGKIWK